MRPRSVSIDRLVVSGDVRALRPDLLARLVAEAVQARFGGSAHAPAARGTEARVAGAVAAAVEHSTRGRP